MAAAAGLTSKKHRVRMLYKRFSRTAYTFLVTRTEAVFADEDLPERRWRARVRWFGEYQRFVEIQWASSHGRNLLSP